MKMKTTEDKKNKIEVTNLFAITSKDIALLQKRRFNFDFTKYSESEADQSKITAQRCKVKYLMQQYTLAGLPYPAIKDEDYLNSSSIPNDNLDSEVSSKTYRRSLLDLLDKENKHSEKDNSSVSVEEKTEKKEELADITEDKKVKGS